MFGPDDEEKSDSEKRAEEPSKEKEDNGVEKEVKDKTEVKCQGQAKIKEDKKEDKETDKEEKVKPVAEVKEEKVEKKDKKVKEETKRAETKETVTTVVAKQPQKVEPTSGNVEEPMAVSDESEEEPKGTSSKPQTEVKSKDVNVNETNNKNKKAEHPKETVNESNADDGASSDDLDNLLKIEQECHMLQDFVAKQSETGSDVEQDIELEKEEEMMEVDLEIDLQIKENADKKKTEKVEIKKVEDQKKDDSKNEEDEPNMNETSIVVMADLTAEDFDDEPLVIDESVKSVGEAELSGDDKIGDEPTGGLNRDAEKSPPGGATEIDIAQTPSKPAFLSTSPDEIASIEENKESSQNNKMEPKTPTATAEADATSSEPKPEDAKQKVETMSELIRTLTSDSEPVKSVNPLVIAPVDEVKREGSSPATPASCMQTITPLASLQAVLTATQRSLPTTTAAEARLLQAGIQVETFTVTALYDPLSFTAKWIFRKQECIPVGCVPPVAVAVGGCLHQAPPGTMHPPPGPTHACKHITLPQTSFAGGKDVGNNESSVNLVPILTVGTFG